MAMQGKAGRSIKPVGQRSISSMFSNSRHLTAGSRSGNGRPLSLMEFLNRKSEKRTPIQGCVADAGLTLEVRERLESTRKIDNIRSNNKRNHERSESINNNDSSCADGSSWPFLRGKIFFRDQGDGMRQVNSVEEECSTSVCQDETPTGKAQVDAQALDRSRNRVQLVPPRLEIFSKQSGSRSAMDAGSCDSTYNFHKNLDGHHVPEAASQSRGVDFIDLTEDEEDPGVGNCLAGEDDLHGVNTETVDHRKRRRRSQSEPGTTVEICPVCMEMFPPHMLQAHVESELDAQEMLGTNAVPEAHGVVPAGRHELPHLNVGHEDGWELNHARFGPDDAEWSAQLKEPGSKSSRPGHKSVLVLGDEPKHRRQPNVGSHNHKRLLNSSAATFNHYADGAGWWDEGGVGVDAEAVGSASVWEGLGSMSFGGML